MFLVSLLFVAVQRSIPTHLLNLFLISITYVRWDVSTFTMLFNLQFIPEQGITVYANLLHSHTVGE